MPARRRDSTRCSRPWMPNCRCCPPTARQVAGLKGRAGAGSDTDAVVVLEALGVPGSAILTGDPDDMHALLEVSGSACRVPVLRV